jgi:Sulfotransferase family
MTLEFTLDVIHGAMRRLTGLKLVSDLHERPTFPGIYPPLDPTLRRRLRCVRDAGVLFIHIPKNAGTSVSNILYGEQLFHPTIRYYQRVASDMVRTLPSFAVWRDPVERFASAYRYARAGGGEGSSVSRAFRDRYMAFASLDDALDHVEASQSLYDTDHIFRPQFWYVADMAGRIAVDNICMIDDLDRAVAGDALPGLRDIACLNRSKPMEVAPTAEQVRRLQRLYPIDFVIHDALREKSRANALNTRRVIAQNQNKGIRSFSSTTL